MPRRRSPKPNSAEHNMTCSLDALAEFQDFQDDVLKFLRRALAEGKSRDEIEKHPKVQALLAARQVTMALTEQDAGKALAAIKDLRDRTEGRAVERKEIRTRIEEAPDEALDARLKTLLGQESDDSDDVKH
jgi:hypothetical protein